jgi:FtsH-binding integral membrane protein
MSQFPNPYSSNPRSQPLQYESSADVTTVAQFFNTVYAWMASGLALTAVVAWWVSTQPQLMRQIFQGPVLIILVLAELGLVFAVSAGINRFSATTATVLFMIYSGLNGLTLSAIFVIYTKASLASTFVVTAGTFGAMSLYGFVTKRDLTSLGSMLFMALIGLVLASLVNLFLHNETLYWIVTYAGVLIFVGLTAYDTQKLRNYAVQTGGNKEMSNRLAIYGALNLYLDFINLFLFLLRLMGNRK